MKQIFSLLFLCTAGLSAQIPDVTFGNNGFVYLPEPVTGLARVRVNSLSDGKILLSGSRISTMTNREDFVVRLMANGTIDTSYGNSGYYLFSDTIDDINAAQVFAMPDGSLVCLTHDIGSALIKLQPNGTIDPSFTPNAGYSNFSIQDFAFTDSNGHLYFIAPATLYNLQRIDMETGLVDTSFGTVNNTLPLINAAPIDTDAPGIATADGKFILLSRFQTIDNNYQCYIKRVLPTGEVDPAFGDNGKARLYGAPESAIDDFSDMYESYAADQTGALYVASSNGNTLMTTIYKLDPSGQPDLDFGIGGKLAMPVNHFVVNTYWHENSLYVLGQKIVSGLNGDMMIGKYDANGMPDANFGTNGIYAETTNPFYESGETMAFANDGSILVAGETREENVRRACVFKYAGSPLAIQQQHKNNFSYANPVTGQLVIRSDIPVVSMAFYGMDGQLLRQTNEAVLTTSDLPAGLYFAKVELSDKSIRRIKILKN